MTAKRASLVAFGILFVLTIFFLTAFPPATPRVLLNHRRAVKSIRTFNLAESDHVSRYPEVGFACNITDLAPELDPEQPSTGPLRDRVLLSGKKAGYLFEIRCLQNDGQKAVGYNVTAVPTQPGVTGTFALCSDQTGQVWYSENGSAEDCLKMRKQIGHEYEE
jgi:hypothetical protein